MNIQEKEKETENEKENIIKDASNQFVNIKDGILLLFSLFHINLISLDELNGLTIERNILLDSQKYNLIQENYISKFKQFFSSKNMTSLHSNTENQKWPLINLFRQLLKACNFKMIPFKKHDSYDSNKKKIFKRYFLIKKM